MRKNVFLLFAFSSLLISYASVAWAQEDDRVGSVIAIRGKVTALTLQGAVRELSLKSPVFRHDTLKTGPQGRLQVLFSDNTIISLGKESQIEIAEHVWKPGQKNGAMKTKVKEGVFRVMGGAIAKDNPEAFTTETPAATIGIRGSMYAGRVENGMLNVVFEGGKGIYVANNAGEVLITRPGFGTHIQGAGTPPETPKRISTQAVSDLNSDLSVSGQTEEDGTTAPDGAPATQDQADAGSSESSGQSTSNAGTSDQTATDGGTGSGSQSQTPQDGDTGTGLSTFSSADTTQTVDTPLTSGLPSVPFTEPTTSPGPTNPATDANGGPIYQDPVDTIVAPVIAMSGASMSALADINNYWNTNNSGYYSESLTATSTAGLIACTLTAPGGAVYGFSFTIPSYNPLGTYVPSDVQKSAVPGTISLLGADRTFTWYIAADPLGEFAIYNTLSSFTETATYDFAELGYVGVPSASAIRTNGIGFYQGPALGFEEIIEPDPSTVRRDFGSGSMGMEVNWLNGKAIGVIDFNNFETTNPTGQDSKGLFFFFGTVDRTTGALTNVRFLGSRGPEQQDPTGPVAWIEGSTFSGRFYGSDNQGFGFMGTGNDFDIKSNMTSRVGVSRIDGAVFMGAQDPIDATSPTGTATFSGFVVGVAEQMNNPFVSRREYMNMEPSKFVLSIDRNQGTVAGTLSAMDYIYPAGITLTNIEVGGTFGSAYVLDDNFAAIFGDTGSDAVHNYTDQGGLKPYANYLITAKPDEQVSDYVTWGYWEIAYTDPTTLQSYHVHQPGAFWVAGELTNSTVLQSMADNNLTGHYMGTATGVRFDSGSQLSPLTNGSTNLWFDFRPSATAPVSGLIQFSEVQMDLTSGTIDVATSRFSANTNIGGNPSGGAFGAFYGPNAEAVGGNFRAQSGGTTYIGVFNGGKQ